MKADKANGSVRNKTVLFETKHSGPLNRSPLPFQPSPSGAAPAELTINIT